MSTSYEYYVIPVIPAIPMEDSIIHTATHPFCSDAACPCHVDPEACAELTRSFNEGLITLDEGERLYQGGAL